MSVGPKTVIRGCEVCEVCEACEACEACETCECYHKPFAQRLARREILTWEGEVSHGRHLGRVLEGRSTDTVHMQRTFKFSCDVFWLIDTRASCGRSSSSSSAQLVQIREFGFFEVHDVGCGRGGRQTHGLRLEARVEACVSTFTFSFREGRHICFCIFTCRQKSLRKLAEDAWLFALHRHHVLRVLLGVDNSMWAHQQGTVNTGR